jgi:hypothetical protein
MDTVFNPPTILRGSSTNIPMNQKPFIPLKDIIFNADLNYEISNEAYQCTDTKFNTPEPKNVLINNYNRLDTVFNPLTEDPNGISGLSRKGTILGGNEDSRRSANFGVLSEESREGFGDVDLVNNEENTETKTTKERCSIKTEKTGGRTIQEEIKTSTTTTIVKNSKERYKFETITTKKTETNISAESERKITRTGTFGGDELEASWRTAGFKSQEEKGGKLESPDSVQKLSEKFGSGPKDNVTFCPDN